MHQYEQQADDTNPGNGNLRHPGFRDTCGFQNDVVCELPALLSKSSAPKRSNKWLRLVSLYCAATVGVLVHSAKRYSKLSSIVWGDLYTLSVAYT
ncbi:hypothetical protein D3C71_1734070 [compost metagenome]